MDLCMSGITCQKVGEIYRLRFITKRPGLANEVPMFMGYGSFLPLCYTCFLSHSITASASVFKEMFL